MSIGRVFDSVSSNKLADKTAARVETGQMGSNRTPADYRALAKNYRVFAANLMKIREATDLE